jgi:hypothetical protein
LLWAFLCLVLSTPLLAENTEEFAGINCPGDQYVECDDELWDLTIYGNATYKDYSGTHDAGEPEVKRYLNSCGQGHIKRTWKVKIYNQWHSCSQYIYVGGGDNDITIHWPKDLELDGCNPVTDPDLLPNGRPTWTYSECAMLASNYRDTYFNFGSSSCKKIIREWTVMDWCTYDAVRNPHEGIYKNRQVIKITKEDIPVLTCPDDITVASYNCESAFAEIPPLEVDPATCGGEFTVKNNSPYADNTGKDISGTYPKGTTKVTYSVKYGCGHQVTCTVKITVTDNKAPTPYCRGDLTVALMGVDTDGDHRNDQGMVEIWAKDLDAGSYASCGQEKLFYSFSEDTTDNVRVFTCDDVGINEVFLYVTDGSGNQNFCSVKLSVQNNGANIINCSPDTDQKSSEEEGPSNSENVQFSSGIDSSIYVSGVVTDPFGNAVTGTGVSITDYKGDFELDTFQTSETIFYLDSVFVDGVWDIKLQIDTLEKLEFDTIYRETHNTIEPENDGSYMISNFFRPNNDYMVTGLGLSIDHRMPQVNDLRMLYDHVTGINPFSESYQYLAADLNQDKIIDFQDVSEMINLLSGNINSFQNGYYKIVNQHVNQLGQGVLKEDNLSYYQFNNLSESIQGADFMVVYLGIFSIDDNELNRNNIQTREINWSELQGLNKTELERSLSKIFGYERKNDLSLNSFPNPVSQTLTLEWESSVEEATSIVLVDSRGRKVHEVNQLSSIGNNSLQISVNDFPSGLYFVNVNLQKGSSTKKIIINR